MSHLFLVLPLLVNAFIIPKAIYFSNMFLSFNMLGHVNLLSDV